MSIISDDIDTTPILSRFRRQLSPDQADELVHRRVGDRSPNVVTATLAEDMTTGTPAFAYLPIDEDEGERFRSVLLTDTSVTLAPEPYTRLAEHIRATLAAAVDVVGASPEWAPLAETTWTPSDVHTGTAGVVDYHRDQDEPDDGVPSGWAAVPVFRHGTRGGCVDLPEFDVTVESRDGWMVVFPRWAVRGVSTTRPTRDDGYRCGRMFVSSGV